jgi:S-adenosylmethionine/arginine decarboxylase-like enzyme
VLVFKLIKLVLYEISNIIEVYVETRTPCNSWNTPNGGNGVIGIKMHGRYTLLLSLLEEILVHWTAFNEAWRFTPNGPSATTFQWLEGTTPISTNTNIVVCPTVTTTYTAEVTYNQCGQIYTVSSPVTVTVYPDDTQSPIDLTECGNPFDLTENDATILGSLNPSDYEINYFLTQTDAELGTNIITNPTTFNSTSNPQTIYAGIQNYNTGCNLVKEFELIISSCNLDPQPNPLSSCDDNPVDGFTLFDLTQSDTAALNGLDATLYTVTYHNSQADANTGNAPITPATAYNGFNGEIIYVRVEENAAPTTFGTTSFALTIRPTPSIADVVQTICSGDTFTVTPTNTAPDVVPTGTTYTWTVAAPAGITGASTKLQHKRVSVKH